MAKGRGTGRRARAVRATPARLLAVDITRQCRLRDAYVRELVNTRRKTSELSHEEFDYAQVLSFGVVMCRGTLDEFIDRNLNSPHDVKAEVRDCLRISAYELLFLKKPSHAVVDQGVELVRATSPKASGLANAVLHKMAADAAGFPWGDATTSIRAFARSYGVPKWLARLLVRQYGREKAAAMLAADLLPAPTFLRDNPYQPGERFASDLSAQHVASLVPLAGTVLEIGAGRGTKTALMQARALEELGHPTIIHTVDIHEFKARLLSERMEQMGIPGVTTHVGDATNLDAIAGLPRAFDAVFIDAPCSGTGTLRRHPEIRWRIDPRDIESLTQVQAQMLQSAASYVRAGGTLVYATCSVLDSENDALVRAFLDTPAGAQFTLAERFASVPAEGGPDGHFAVVLRK